MPEYQSTYDASLAIGSPGMVATDSDFENIVSKQIETATVGFGLAVGAGAADGSVKLSGTGYEGVTVMDKAQTSGDYAVGVTAAIMNRGTIFVTVDGNVTPSGTVTYTEATGAIGVKAVAAGIVAIPNAKFLDTVSSGGIARLFLG